MTSPVISSVETETAPNAAPESGSASGRLWREIWRTFDAPFWLANHLPRLLPAPLAGRVRPRLFKLAGVSIGPGCFLWGAFGMNATPKVRQNLRIGDHCFFNAPVWLGLNAPVIFGMNVSVGHHAIFITAHHQIGSSEYRAGALTPRPITVGDGVWIGANVTVLPGVCIGSGAVIAAGATVARDVPANVLAGGTPAKVIRAL